MALRARSAAERRVERGGTAQAPAREASDRTSDSSSAAEGSSPISAPLILVLGATLAVAMYFTVGQWAATFWGSVTLMTAGRVSAFGKLPKGILVLATVGFAAMLVFGAPHAVPSKAELARKEYEEKLRQYFHSA